MNSTVNGPNLSETPSEPGPRRNDNSSPLGEYLLPTPQLLPTFSTSHQNQFPTFSRDKPVPSILPSLVVSIGQLNGLLPLEHPLRSQPTSISSEAAECIASLCEFRIRQLIQEARKIQHHSCSRNQKDPMSSSDVRIALQLLRMQSVWGVPSKCDQLTVSPESATVPYSNSLQRRNLHTSQNGPIPSSGLDYFDKAQETRFAVDTAKFANRPIADSGHGCLPFVSVTWLAVDGEVPKTLENCTETTTPYESLPSDLAMSSICRIDRQHHLIANAVKKNPLRPNGLVNCSGSASMGEDESLPVLDEVVQIERVDHRLSKEHQMLLSQVRGTVRQALTRARGDPNVEALASVFASLEVDAGSPQLIPYFIHFGANEIYKLLELTDPPVYGLRIFVKFFGSMISNPSLRLFNYAHQILNPLLCITLCTDICGLDGDPQGQALLPMTNCTASANDICELRRAAANTVADLAFKSAHQMPSSIFVRLSNLYRRFLCNLSTPVSTMLGAVMGVRALGAKCVRLVALPVIPILLAAVEIAEEYQLMTVSQNIPSPIMTKRLELRTALLRELLGCVEDAIEPSYIDSYATDSGEVDEMTKVFLGLSEMENEKLIPHIASATQKIKHLLNTDQHDDFYPDTPEYERPTSKPLFSIGEIGGSSIARKRQTEVDNAALAAKKTKKDFLESQIRRQAEEKGKGCNNNIDADGQEPVNSLGGGLGVEGHLTDYDVSSVALNGLMLNL